MKCAHLIFLRDDKLHKDLVLGVCIALTVVRITDLGGGSGVLMVCRVVIFSYFAESRSTAQSQTVHEPPTLTLLQEYQGGGPATAYRAPRLSHALQQLFHCEHPRVLRPLVLRHQDQLLVSRQDAERTFLV